MVPHGEKKGLKLKKNTLKGEGESHIGEGGSWGSPNEAIKVGLLLTCGSHMKGENSQGLGRKFPKSLREN